FASRRIRVLRSLRRSVALVFAGDHDPHSEGAYRPDPHFEYLTGVTDEPGAALVLDPTSPNARRRAMLFLRPLDPEVEKWDGYRLHVSEALRKKTGFDSIYRLGQLPRFLGIAAGRSKSLACLHALANYNQPVSRDLEVFRKIA